VRLAVIIPTYNRSASLARTLRSLLAAPVPPGLEVRVIAVDNRSTDDTTATVERFSLRSGGMVQYVRESQQQGRSFALNTGIRSSDSEILAFVDDDEEVDERWFEVIYEAFSNPDLDYIGGRYLPRWELPPPAWVDHPHTRTAIGWADFGAVARPYSDVGFDALLMGGNSVLRRRCFEQVGLYSENLGRKGARLLAGEDTDMHQRLIANGLVGWYLPGLVVYHHIPAARLRRSYMRKWAFWASVSEGCMMRETGQDRGSSRPMWFGIPRSLYARAFLSPFRWLGSILSRENSAEVFHYELTVWGFIGMFYGRNFRSPAGN